MKVRTKIKCMTPLTRVNFRTHKLETVAIGIAEDVNENIMFYSEVVEKALACMVSGTTVELTLEADYKKNMKTLEEELVYECHKMKVV